MDIFEFELRYLSFKGLNKRYSLWLDEQIILNLVKRTNKGKLEKKLTETTPDELRELTLQTYTEDKKIFIESHKNIKIESFTLSEYIDRLEYELKVTKEMWYNSYFLIVWDYINRARSQGISVWPGRWSAAWSLMAYLVGITDIDPLIYDLLFERFLNPARISMPDIDTDFEDVQRDKLLDYVKEKYWQEKVASIWTYMTMAAKAAFKDVARTYWISFEQSNRISNLISEKTIQKSIEASEELKWIIDADTNMAKIIEIAIKLEWTIRQTWVHACWVIISPEPVIQYSPIQYPPKSGTKNLKDETRIVSQYDWHFLEDIWLLKMDFLWLRNLSIIKNTIKIYKARANKHWRTIPPLFQEFLNTTGFYPPLTDQKTYEKTFKIWDTNWVFQFESDGMKAWLKKLQPTNIDDIIAMVALYRPWPMEFIPNYIDRKQWIEEVNYMIWEIYSDLKEKYWKEIANEEKRKITEDLSPFMDVTYWIPIYQEQLMRIVQAMAWFSLWEADLLRRWIGKKIKEIIDKLKKEFIEKAWSYKSYKPETCTYVYEKMIEPAARYSFNKSHAACYAIIAYQTAYLKANFPIEFNASLLWSVEEETDKLAKFIDELKMQWYKVMPPSLNESYRHVAAINDTIRIWFLAIKWVWYEVAKFIEEEREKKGNFISFEDFLKRCEPIVNKKSIESMAKAWVFDEFEDRKTILENLNIILDYAKSSKTSSQWLGLFSIDDLWTKLVFKEKFKVSLLHKLLFEYEIFKSFVSAHPFDGLYQYIKSKYNFISMFKDIEDYWEFKIVCFIKDIRRIQKKWFFLSIEDLSWEVSIFLKNVLDLKNFDILILKWFKWKSIRIKEAIKVTIEELIDKAEKSWKYNPEEKVMEVRWKRLWITEKHENIITQDINTIYWSPSVNLGLNWDSGWNTDYEFKENDEYIEVENSIDEDLENIWNNNNMYHTNEDPTPKNEFELPDNISTIKLVSQTIRNNPWKLEIKLNWNTYLISNEGLKIISDLLQ